ncbi:MAG: hypothetical protein IPL26_16440 [Leptospiraceae bacterium]|nr:hypothetical protein [Leptospiraceae bacterium]
MSHLADLIGEKKKGTIVIGFKRLRDVSIIEIRNSINSNEQSLQFDSSLFFYIEKLGKTIQKNNFAIKRYERIKSITPKYRTYEIAYSFEPIHLLKDRIKNYDYIVFYESDDLVSEYESINYAFKRKKGNCLKIKDISELIRFIKDFEIGKLT